MRHKARRRCSCVAQAAPARNAISRRVSASHDRHNPPGKEGSGASTPISAPDCTSDGDWGALEINSSAQLCAASSASLSSASAPPSGSSSGPGSPFPDETKSGRPMSWSASAYGSCSLQIFSWLAGLLPQSALGSSPCKMSDNLRALLMIEKCETRSAQFICGTATRAARATRASALAVVAALARASREVARQIVVSLPPQPIASVRRISGTFQRPRATHAPEAKPSDFLSGLDLHRCPRSRAQADRLRPAAVRMHSDPAPSAGRLLFGAESDSRGCRNNVPGSLNKIFVSSPRSPCTPACW